MKTWSLVGLAVAVLGVVTGLFWVRAAPIDAVLLHISPMEASDPGAAGIRIGPEEIASWALAPKQLFERAVGVISDEAGVSVLVIDEAELLATFVVRTPIWGFPDVVNIQVFPGAEGATLAFHARALRAGYDWGVNRARTAQWIAAISAGS